MNDSFQWWLIIVGIGIGVGLAWLVMGRLARHEDDVSDAERQREAAWISHNIASYGGVASGALVEEVLELHRQYLEGLPLDLPPALPADASEGLTDVVRQERSDVVREERSDVVREERSDVVREERSDVVREERSERTGSTPLRSSR